jgi:hypothetical protein
MLWSYCQIGDLVLGTLCTGRIEFMGTMGTRPRGKKICTLGVKRWCWLLDRGKCGTCKFVRREICNLEKWLMFDKSLLYTLNVPGCVYSLALGSSECSL